MSFFTIEQAPALTAQQAAVDGALAAQPGAATLPDPRLTVGVDNLPISGADTLSLSRDFMTMQRFGLMQEVPNRAKREARAVGAQARIERERAPSEQTAFVRVLVQIPPREIIVEFRGYRQFDRASIVDGVNVNISGNVVCVAES